MELNPLTTLIQEAINTAMEDGHGLGGLILMGGLTYFELNENFAALCLQRDLPIKFLRLEISSHPLPLKIHPSDLTFKSYGVIEADGLFLTIGCVPESSNFRLFGVEIFSCLSDFIEKAKVGSGIPNAHYLANYEPPSTHVNAKVSTVFVEAVRTPLSVYRYHALYKELNVSNIEPSLPPPEGEFEGESESPSTARNRSGRLKL